MPVRKKNREKGFQSTLSGYSRKTPTVLLFILLVSIPIWLTGWLPGWAAEDAKYAVLFLSGPLFMSSCLSPFVTLRVLEKRIPITFSLISFIYFLIFGLRAYYFLFFPEVVMYPNFDPVHDLAWLNRGLLWATLGMWGMTAGYLFLRSRKSDLKYKFPSSRFSCRLEEIFNSCSSPRLFVGLYGLGLAGRVFMIYKGSAIWIYNSPAFDLIAARNRSILDAPMTIFADFCPLVFAAVLAYRYQSKINSFKSRFSGIVLIGMFLIEIAYFSFGLYKYGIFGTLAIFWIVSVIYGRKWFNRGLIGMLLFLIVVLPISNSARQQGILDYYKRSLLPSAEWVVIMMELAEDPYYGQNPLSYHFYLDPLFERLNGAEALAVADKYVPQFGYEKGRTYLNLLNLLIPRALRGWDSNPYYINWAVDYVGLDPSNLTVVPMPLIAEAYVNFGVPGVFSIMFLMGILYGTFDRFGARYARYPVAVGLFAYVLWRCMNIEHNLFIVLPAVIKTVAVALAILWTYDLLIRSSPKYHSLGLDWVGRGANVERPHLDDAARKRGKSGYSGKGSSPRC